MLVKAASIVCGLLLLCTACASPPEPLVDGFRCQAEITYGGAEYVGMLDRTGTNEAVFTLSEPTAMQGLTMRWDGTRVSVSYLGMEMAVTEDQLPIGSVIRVLCDTLDACGDGERGTPASRIEGESTLGTFTLTVDESNGYPLRLQIPAVDFEAAFSLWELSPSV